MTMRVSIILAALAVVLLVSIVEADLTKFSGNHGDGGRCKKECKKPSHCKSDVVINEVDVPKDVNIPSVETREHVVYKKVPVPEYEIKEKVTTKLVQVPSRQFSFRKKYIDRPTKVQLKKPLIKYNVTYVDVEVERLVIHDKPVLRNVSVERIKYVPDIQDRYEPITINKRRPIGKPQPEPKQVTIPNGVNRVRKEVVKEVKVPEITYHYCDTEKNIYVPDKCDPPGGSSSSSGGAVSVTRSASFSVGSGPVSPFGSGSAFGTASGNSFLNPPSHDEGSRFVRNPAPEAAALDTPAEVEAPLPQEVSPEEEGSNISGAGRFGRAIGSFLSTNPFKSTEN